MVFPRTCGGIMLSDQNMPGGTGIDLCRWLRGLGSIVRGSRFEAGAPSSARAAFVLLTAFPEQVLDQDLEGLRIAAVLGKPWDCPALRVTVRNLLEGDTLAAP